VTQASRFTAAGAGPPAGVFTVAAMSSAKAPIGAEGAVIQAKNAGWSLPNEEGSRLSVIQSTSAFGSAPVSGRAWAKICRVSSTGGWGRTWRVGIFRL
jgi:hypothetical protein